MTQVIILVFFILIAAFGFYPQFHTRSTRENVFYLVCFGLSVSVLLIRSFDISLPDPTRYLLEFARRFTLY